MISTDTLKGKAIASSKRNPCPICQKPHGCKLSDDLILCLRGESTWSIPGWKYIKPLQGGMGSLWGTDTGTKREYRPEPKPAKPSQFKPLTDEQLDKNARLILKQLGLNAHHRQSLRERGLSDTQIDSIGYKSVDAYQEFMTPINPNFPGMGNRGTLTNSGSGILIPIRNIKGLIVGFQLARDDRDPKYQWLWGSRERRVSGELPLQFLKINDSTELNITEATLKSQISAYSHNINVLGAGGVNWQGSPKEFEAIIHSGLFNRYILNPDTGSKLNHHVMGAYRALFLFLKQHGITLYVRDWGQGDRPKSDQLDVDEIDTQTFNNTRIVPFENWDNFDELQAFLAQHETRKNNAVISENDWFQRFKVPELSQIIKRFYSRWVKNSKPETKPESTPETTPEQATKSSAIVLWKPQKVTSLPYVPGQLPTIEEWRQLGCPKFYIPDGTTLEFIAEAREKGYQYLKDSTPTGHGKSYDAGLINLETFGIDPTDKDDKTKIYYLSPDHRNPTNITIERNYYDLDGRHGGLVYDRTKTTPSGRFHLLRAKPGQSADVPSNCPENGTFQAVSELGHHVFGGKDSPICQACPRLEEGCSFLINRRDTLNNERLIRADINSSPTPKANDILIFEEAGVTIKNNQQVTVSIDDILKTVGKLRLRDDERIFKALRPMLVAVYKSLQSITSDKHKYGISHREVMKLMLSIDELNPVIFEPYFDDWLKAKDVWGEPDWHYEMINGEAEAVKILGYHWIAPSLQDLKNECKKILENYGKYINGLQSPEEKQQAIKNNVISPWLVFLLEALTGNKRVNLRIDQGKLTLTKLSNRHRSIIKNAGFSIALDATLSKEDYALAIGVKSDEILEYSKVKKDTPNQHIHIINGLGKGGKQRRDTMQQRIDFAVKAIAQRHQGQKIGLIDHKSAIDSYKDLAQFIKRGYWHKDTRGSNQFLDTQVLISVGLPIPNLGQMAAEWQILTGQVIKNPEQLTGRYGDWVKRKIRSELIQYVGRLRAHLRPDEQLHVYLVADLDDDTISAIRLAYPTATVVVEDIYDYAPEAASKGKQTERGIINALWASIKSGTAATIDQIAEALTLTKGGVTKCLKDRLDMGFRAIKKSLLLLYNALNSKSKLFDLPDDARWMAETYLPNVVADLEGGHITAADVVAEVLDVPRCFGRDVGKQILAATPIPTLCKLLGVVLRFLPNQIKQELAGWIHQHYSPPLPLPA